MYFTSYKQHLSKNIKTHTGIGTFAQWGIKILMPPPAGPLSELSLLNWDNGSDIHL